MRCNLAKTHLLSRIICHSQTVYYSDSVDEEQDSSEEEETTGKSPKPTKEF